jgi:4-amino-4-deoxy-L-arabinose transferase-like glycosyltransferase
MVGPYLVFGRSYVAAHLTIVLLSTATCVISAWLATQFAGPVVGLLAGLWLAVYPGHFYYSVHFLSEPVFGFWLAAASALSYRAFAKDRLQLSTLGGLCWGAAILTRIELILLIPMTWAAALIRRSEARLIRHVALQSGIALVIATLWIVRNAVMMGAPVLSTQAGYVWWGAHNSITMTDGRFAGSWVNAVELVDASHPLYGSEVDRSRLGMRYGTESIRQYATRMPYLTAMKLWRFVDPVFETSNKIALVALAGGWIVTAPFVIFGIWHSAGEGLKHPRVILLLPLLTAVVNAMVFYGSGRFRDGVSPLFIIFAALGLSKALQSWRIQPRLTTAAPVPRA